MKKNDISNVRKYLSIFALGAAGGSIYLIPFIRYVFYAWQAEAMAITDAQMGFLTTIYAIGNVFVYIPGGIISDKFSTKKSMLFSLLSTTILTFIFACKVDSYELALVIWFLFAFTTTFLFWCSLMKTIRLLGDEHEQGFLFGLYYMGNGLTGAITNAVAMLFTSESATATQNFQAGVWTYGVSTLVAFILVLFIIKDNKESENFSEDQFQMSQVKGLLQSPYVWCFSIIVFTGYSIFSSTTYFTPYLTEVMGISTSDSGYLSIIRSYLFYILTPVSGIIADRVVRSTSKWFMLLFAILTALFIGVMYIPSTASSEFVGIYSLLPGLFGLALYGLIFSVANEAKISATVMGTAVGIASIIGYAPDFFMPAMFGSWLDVAREANNIAAGYNKIFIFLAGCCFVGLLSSGYIYTKMKKSSEPLG